MGGILTAIMQKEPSESNAAVSIKELGSNDTEDSTNCMPKADSNAVSPQDSFVRQMFQG